MASFRMVAKLQAGLFGCTPRFHSALRTRPPLNLLHKIQPRQHQWRPCQVVFSSTLAPSSDEAWVRYRRGRPVLSVPLPSRQERCVFFLRPLLTSVGDLLSDLTEEDPGVTSVSVLTHDGESIPSSTLIDTLLDSDFQLHINSIVYHIQAPEKEKEAVQGVGVEEGGVEDMKHMVHLLHTALHLPDHHLLQERRLLGRLDSLRQELAPLEEAKARVARRAEARSSRVVWGGLAGLSLQGGALAWLTWWVYSWDVMEPVTYFLTYATSIGVFSYYVLTKEDYVYPSAKDRQFLHHFYKGAKRESLDVEKYNQLRDQLAEVEEDLRRLRNPTHLQMPVEHIQPKQ